MAGRPRPGAPETIEVGFAIIEAMLSPIPVFWQLYLIPLWDPTPISTESLCAVEPGPVETWGVQDLVALLDSNQHQAIIDKLARMVKAGVWNTYCEQIPEESTYDYGEPIWLGDASFGTTIWHADGSPLISAMTPAEADFWVFASKCLEAPTTPEDLPKLTVERPEGATEPEPSLGGWYATVGDVDVAFIPRHGNVPYFGTPNTVGIDPNTGAWKIYRPGSGMWEIALSAWRLNVRQPDVPGPWPYAPADLPGFQFTDAQAEQIRTMASQWPEHRLGMSLVPGQLLDLWSTSNENRDLILAAIAAIPIAAGHTVSVGTVSGPWSGAPRLSIPPNAVGALLQFDTLPEHMARIGESPMLVWDLGYWSTADQYGGWRASQRLKHPMMTVPFPDDQVLFGLELAEGTAVYVWFWISTPS